MSFCSSSRWMVVSVVLWAFVGTSGFLFGDEPQNALVDRVEKLFSICNRPDVPGCAVGIVQNGRLIYSKGFGTANLDYAAPNSPETIFEIASASKGFTSACIAILMDEGKLHPDDDVRRFVPELNNLEHPVRIRHMLRCESGLWDQFHILPLAGWENVPIHAAYSKADLLTVLSGQKHLPFEPGTGFQYGSGDFFLLGLVVERISGKTLAEFARERLFMPLGMTRTYYEEDASLSVKNRAVGHWKKDEGWSSRFPPAKSSWRLWQANGYAAGGGGVRTCLEDLYRWDLAFDSDVLPRGEFLGEFLTQGSVLGNRFVVDADAYKKREQPNSANEPAGQYRGLKRMQFTGGFWGMTACFSRFPEQKFTVICLSNSSEVSAFTKTREIADLFLADQLKPVAKPPNADEEFISLASNELEALRGAYRQPGDSSVWSIELRNNDLEVVDHLDHAYVLKPLTATRFKAIGPSPFYASARFDFTRGDSGPATGFVLSSQENGFHEAYRFSRVELAQPKVDELADYAGTYLSEELGAIYRFKIDQDALWLRVNSRRWERLRPLVRDEFTPHKRDPHDQRFIRFTRNAEGAVDGFSIGFWRIRGVRFSKSALESRL